MWEPARQRRCPPWKPPHLVGRARRGWAQSQPQRAAVSRGPASRPSAQAGSWVPQAGECLVRAGEWPRRAGRTRRELLPLGPSRPVPRRLSGNVPKRIPSSPRPVQLAQEARRSWPGPSSGHRKRQALPTGRGRTRQAQVPRRRGAPPANVPARRGRPRAQVPGSGPHGGPRAQEPGLAPVPGLLAVWSRIPGRTCTGPGFPCRSENR